ncbi:hypothetical protein [Jannaschia seohaensis]|uniref:VWA domain-containing protein n=1 Tax=Jannaschia seohaensis TaxID=475081 RepID=A0A2Y9AR48_9RHOB|nr:hypothetical protein [Jannaschia seohaensis]PWJ18337.1 hypothetical protein BCF38_105326 [Jannaschia seohaensis]SSA46864.1 hypothetical protein SAMN05421539_105326 [Jannaschia seohaensis]
MARRRRSRRRGGAGKTVVGVLLIAVALAGFGGLGWMLWDRAQAPGLDAATLCPADGPVGHLAILIDTTDPISPTQLARARAEITREIAAAPDFTRVSLATVSGAATPVRSLCKPPRDASALTANPRLVAERYEAEFLAPVAQALDGLLAVPEADSSPIIEALQRFLAAIPGWGEAPARVVLVTDLVQHSEVFSFYRGGDWDSFRASGGADRLARNLDGAEVAILRFPRPAAPRAAVEDFWVRYLDAQGAARVSPTVLGDL